MGQYPTHFVDHEKTIVMRKDQIPDSCATAGDDPIGVTDGTFNISNTDLYMNIKDGLRLIRTYRSEKRGIYNQANDIFNYYVMPFGEGGWTHSYIRFIRITEEPSSSNLYCSVGSGNYTRRVRYISNLGGTNFADLYKPHTGLEKIDNDHYKYKKPDGSIEYYTRSLYYDTTIAFVDSVIKKGHKILTFYYNADTLKNVEDRWGDRIEFYYSHLPIGGDSTDSIFLLTKVKFSNRNDWIEYKYRYFQVLDNKKVYRLSQVVKHIPNGSSEDIIVLDRYYYDSKTKTDIVTRVVPQDLYTEDNDTTEAGYSSHRTTGKRVNNWYKEFDGIYYQEVVSGDTILSRAYIDRFFGYHHRVDSVYVYHWEDLPQLGAHDPLDTTFVPSIDSLGSNYYLEIIRYNQDGTRLSRTVDGKTTYYNNYDDDYNPLSITGPDGNTTAYEYYVYTIGTRIRHSPYPTKIKYANGDSVLNFYSQPLPENPYYIQLDSTIDEMGRKTVYLYDVNHNLDKVILKNRYIAGDGIQDITTDYEYNSEDNLLEVIDPEGRITYYEYNDNNNGPLLLREGIDIGRNGIRNDDIMTFYYYDVLGRDTMIVATRNGYNPDGNSVLDSTHYLYDEMDKIKKIIYPGGNSEEFIYDKAGNLVEKREPDVAGNMVKTYEYSYYPLGRLESVREYEGNNQPYTTEYQYNFDGKLLKFTNANGKTITYNYNGGNLIFIHYPDSTVDSLGYYPCCGMLHFKKDREGKVKEFIYDIRHRLTKKLYYTSLTDFNNHTPYDSVMYEYNNGGELTKMKDKTGDIIYTRDDIGNVDTMKVYSLFNKVYKYDLTGMKTGFKAYYVLDPSNPYINQSYQYDDAARVKSTTVDKKTWDVSYYDNGALKKITYPLIPEVGRPKEIYETGSRGEILKIYGMIDSLPNEIPPFYQIDYGYDRRLNRNHQHILMPDGIEEDIAYNYDNINRLTTINYRKIIEKDVAYTYDPVGNRLTKSENGTVTETYNYNTNNNRLRSITETGATFEYNKRGDLTSRDGGYTYSYDKDGRMTKVHWDNDFGSYNELIFLYTPEGKRIRKIHHWGNYGTKTLNLQDAENDLLNTTGTGDDYRDIEELKAVDIDSLLEIGIKFYNNDTTFFFNYRNVYIVVENGKKKGQILPHTNGVKFTTGWDWIIYIKDIGDFGVITPEGDTIKNPLWINVSIKSGMDKPILDIKAVREYLKLKKRNKAISVYTTPKDQALLTDIVPNGVLEGEALKAPPGPTEYADTTYYIYDGINCVAELDGDYNLRNKYIYGNGLLLGRMDSKGEFYFYGHDGLGSIISLYDSKGTMRNYYIYDAYGKFLYKYEEVDNHYYYTGQEKDGSPSGFYNLRNRYYYANIGRFTQEDPVIQINESSFFGCGAVNITPIFEYQDNPEALNPYLYVLNNPVNATDITGEKVLYCDKVRSIPPRGVHVYLKFEDGPYSGQTWGFRQRGKLQPLKMQLAMVIEDTPLNSGGRCQKVTSNNSWDTCVMKEIINSMYKAYSGELKYNLFKFNCRHWAKMILGSCGL